MPRGVVVYYTTNSRDRAMRRLARPLAQIAHTGKVLDAGPATRTFAAAPSESPGALLARRFLETVHADDTTRRAGVSALFSPGLVERRGVEALIGLFARVRGDIGSAEVRAIEESRGPTGALTAVRIRLEGPAGGRRSLTLVIAPGEAPSIDGIELEMGD